MAAWSITWRIELRSWQHTVSSRQKSRWRGTWFFIWLRLRQRIRESRAKWPAQPNNDAKVASHQLNFEKKAWSRQNLKRYSKWYRRHHLSSQVNAWRACNNHGGRSNVNRLTLGTTKDVWDLNQGFWYGGAKHSSNLNHWPYLASEKNGLCLEKIHWWHRDALPLENLDQEIARQYDNRLWVL